MTWSHPSISSLLFDTAVVSQLWQIAVPTASSLYQPVGSEELSLPWGFLSSVFHNRSKNKHVQTQAAVRFVENWLDYSQPATASVPAESFSVLVAVEQHPVALQLFLLVLTLIWFTVMTCMVCHCRLGHCLRPMKPQQGLGSFVFVSFFSCSPDISTCGN